MRKKVTVLMIGFLCMQIFFACGVPKYEKHMKKASKYMEKEDYDSAVEAYAKAVEYDEKSLEAYCGLLLAKVHQGMEYVDVQDTVDAGFVLIEEKLFAKEGITPEEEKLAVDFYDTVVTLFEGTSDEKLALLDKGVKLFGTDLDYDEAFMEEITNVAESFLGENDFFKAKEYVELKQTEYPDNENISEYTETIHEMLLSVLCENVEYYLEEKNYKYAKEYVDIALSFFPDSESVKTLKESAYAKYEEEQRYAELLTKIGTCIETKDYAGIVDLSMTDAYKEINEMISYGGKFLYLPEGRTEGKGVGIYSIEGCGCVQFYYGDIKDGKREGNGTWVHVECDENSLLVNCYEGGFADDKPNGAGSMWYKFNDIEIYLIQGNFNNGLYNGSVSDHLYGEKDEKIPFEYTVVDGVIQGIEVEDWIEEVREANERIIGVNYTTLEDGRIYATWAAVDLDSKKIGVLHFR